MYRGKTVILLKQLQILRGENIMPKNEEKKGSPLKKKRTKAAAQKKKEVTADSAERKPERAEPRPLA